MTKITCLNFTRKDKNCAHYIQSDIEGEAGFCTLKDEFRCKEALKRFLPSISQSALKMFAHCNMSYKLHYIDGIKLKDKKLPDAMKAGIIIDCAKREFTVKLWMYRNEKMPILSLVYTNVSQILDIRLI